MHEISKINSQFNRNHKKNSHKEPRFNTKKRVIFGTQIIVIKCHPKQQKKKKTEQTATQIDMEGMITFDQFGKVELRVAEIVAAEKIKKADKLLKLTLNAPEERMVVAGIAKQYTPEELVGMKVIIVANLKPAKLMGVTSQGMVLAAKEKDEDGNERLVLSTVAGDIAIGSRVA